MNIILNTLWAEQTNYAHIPNSLIPILSSSSSFRFFSTIQLNTHNCTRYLCELFWRGDILENLREYIHGICRVFSHLREREREREREERERDLILIGFLVGGGWVNIGQKSKKRKDWLPTSHWGQYLIRYLKGRYSSAFRWSPIVTVSNLEPG